MLSRPVSVSRVQVKSLPSPSAPQLPEMLSARAVRLSWGSKEQTRARHRSRAAALLQVFIYRTSNNFTQPGVPASLRTPPRLTGRSSIPNKSGKDKHTKCKKTSPFLTKSAKVQNSPRRRQKRVDNCTKLFYNKHVNIRKGVAETRPDYRTAANGGTVEAPAFFARSATSKRPARSGTGAPVTGQLDARPDRVIRVVPRALRP